LLSNLLGVARSPLLLEKSFAQANPFRVVPFQSMALDAAAVTHASLTDVAFPARDTGKKPLQSQLGRCFSVDDLHVEIVAN
jgi:hypothetical protein